MIDFFMTTYSDNEVKLLKIKLRFATLWCSFLCVHASVLVKEVLPTLSLPFYCKDSPVFQKGLHLFASFQLAKASVGTNCNIMNDGFEVLADCS